MCKKHYIAIARVIATIRNDLERERVAIAVSLVMQADNRKFRAGKFLSACGVLLEVSPCC